MGRFAVASYLRGAYRQPRMDGGKHTHDSADERYADLDARIAAALAE